MNINGPVQRTRRTICFVEKPDSIINHWCGR